jgi:hypothetical protein
LSNANDYFDVSGSLSVTYKVRIKRVLGNARGESVASDGSSECGLAFKRAQLRKHMTLGELSPNRIKMKQVKDKTGF